MRSKKTGRPNLPDDKRRSERIDARLTVEEKAVWTRLGASEWLRSQLRRWKHKG